MRSKDGFKKTETSAKTRVFNNSKSILFAQKTMATKKIKYYRDTSFGKYSYQYFYAYWDLVKLNLIDMMQPFVGEVILLVILQMLLNICSM